MTLARLENSFHDQVRSNFRDQAMILSYIRDDEEITLGSSCQAQSKSLEKATQSPALGQLCGGGGWVYLGSAATP